MDLRDQVTVFHITVGNINYSDSLKSLKSQNSKFRINTIKDVFPMYRAFQEMLNRCQTPFFVQVDEDFILKPHAISKMFEDIQQTGPKVMFLSYWLWDPHLQRKVMGVKIYKYRIMKNYPYRDSYSCEVDQFKRAEEDGFKWKSMNEVLGKHSPRWTDYTIFQRYKSLLEKHRYSGSLQWVENLGPEFLERVTKKSCRKEDLWAFLGMLSGIINEPKNRERDFRTYGREEFERIKKFFHL